MRPAVVTVVVNMGEGEEGRQGSGFIVSPDGLVVTNWHVIADAQSALVKQEHGAFFPVEGLLAWDLERDFALLKVAAKDLPTIPLGDSHALRQGDSVLVMGSPKGLENTVSQGIVSAIRELPDGRRLIQTTAAVSEGSSGGPLLDMQGRVVGITSFQLVEGQALNFAVAMNEVKDKLKPGREPLALEQAFGPGEHAVAPQALTRSWALYGQGFRALPEDWEGPGAEEAFQVALGFFEAAARAAPDEAKFHFWVASCLSQLGRYDEAIAAYKRAAELRRQWTAPISDLGQTYYEAGRYREALDTYERVFELLVGKGPPEPTNEPWEGLGPPPDYDVLRHAYRGRLAEVQYALGLSYGRLGRNGEEIGAYQHAITWNPEYVDAYINLGAAYLHAQRHQDAILAFKEAIRLKPDDPLTHFNLGVAYGQLGRYQEELEAYKQAIRIKPDDAEAHFNLGVAYGNLGRWQEEIEAYKQAIRIKPDDAKAHFNLGLAYLIYVNDRGRALDEYRTLKVLNEDLAGKLFDLLYP
ncbi:MAG: tetratricopeptide repeat protein [Armatimonadota bacterium]